MSRSAKANAVRDRHLIALKKTIETVLTLTDETCPSTLAIYMEELEANWANYHDAYNEHEDEGKEEELLKTISAEYHETRLGLIKSRIKLGKLAASASAQSGGLSSSMLEQTFGGINNRHDNNDQIKTFKLPSIRLPTFSGELKNWVEFKATCRSILTDQIHDVQRLQFLKDALQNEPRKIVAHILPGDGSYDQAMSLLKRRYENTRNDQLLRLYT